MLLGVNIDHIATLRQARKEGDPDLISAAREAIQGGADGITVHLREDRRHIQDQDVYDLKKLVPRLNLEMSISPEIVAIAKDVKPTFCCLVPEKRQELTTEGGLNVIENKDRLIKVVKDLSQVGIHVSIFIDPDLAQIEMAKEVGAEFIEIHTGKFTIIETEEELFLIKKAAKFAHDLGLKVNAGHGLKYYHISRIKEVSFLEELNIGHSIISRAVFVGLKKAVREMKDLL